MKFVCGPCREGSHDSCRGGTWCDCQHRLDGQLVETMTEEWRVTDRQGVLVMWSSDVQLAQNTAGQIGGATLWYRQHRTTVTPWRAVETVVVDSALAVES